MPKAITIRVGQVTLTGKLNDTATARKIAAALPIEGLCRRWGDEIYFAVPVEADREPDARRDVQVGQIGYWPDGNAVCLFFGATPASDGPQPRAATAVNIIGTFQGDLEALKRTANGLDVTIE
ncbi:MAG: hypothetical protein JW810_00860 [Sedimentisphaerales bacterium]|nr:hypothetical protein [Sedimentisphaerales bacterium]